MAKDETPVPQGQKIDYILGDSIASMCEENVRHTPYKFQSLGDGTSDKGDDDNMGGRHPGMVARAIERILKANPDAFRGKTVLLSTGASNDPGRNLKDPEPQQMEDIQHQLDLLREAGASAVIVLGVGPGNRPPPGEKPVFEKMRWNERLDAAVADQNDGTGTRFIFAGPLKTASYDPIHPAPLPLSTDFEDLVKNATALLNGAAPAPAPEHKATPPAPDAAQQPEPAQDKPATPPPPAPAVVQEEAAKPAKKPEDPPLPPRPPAAGSDEDPIAMMGTLLPFLTEFLQEVQKARMQDGMPPVTQEEREQMRAATTAVDQATEALKDPKKAMESRPDPFETCIGAVTQLLMTEMPIFSAAATAAAERDQPDSAPAAPARSKLGPPGRTMAQVFEDLHRQGEEARATMAQMEQNRQQMAAVYGPPQGYVVAQPVGYALPASRFYAPVTATTSTGPHGVYAGIRVNPLALLHRRNRGPSP